MNLCLYKYKLCQTLLFLFHFTFHGVSIKKLRATSNPIKDSPWMNPRWSLNGKAGRYRYANNLTFVLATLSQQNNLKGSSDFTRQHGDGLPLQSSPTA